MTAAFLYCAARNGIFLKANVVLQRVELQRSDLQHAITLVAQTLALPASPYDRALWKTAAASAAVAKRTTTPQQTINIRSDTCVQKKEQEEKQQEEKPEEEKKKEAPVSWKESVLQELEARRQREAAESAEHEPRRKKMRQTTLLF